jgi:hypothetical protein
MTDISRVADSKMSIVVKHVTDSEAATELLNSDIVRTTLMPTGRFVVRWFPYICSEKNFRRILENCHLFVSYNECETTINAVTFLTINRCQAASFRFDMDTYLDPSSPAASETLTAHVQGCLEYLNSREFDPDAMTYFFVYCPSSIDASGVEEIFKKFQHFWAQNNCLVVDYT